MLHLRVKNFGVLKNIDIELGKTNLFIGDNGSGKSTLAKLITVLTDFTLDEKGISNRLKDFNIDFLNEECFIELKDNNESLIKVQGIVVICSSLKQVKELQSNQNNTTNLILNKLDGIELSNLTNSIISDKSDMTNLSSLIGQSGSDKELENRLKETTEAINQLKSQYIPAERNLISLFNQSLSNMISAEIPLPKTLLEFSAHYNSARNEIKELAILNMTYKNENFQDRIYYGNHKDNNFLALQNSSSGIQSALPLYLTLKYFATKHKDIIIEEPELNLYPKSQVDTVKYMIENRQESSLSIMTHSPYILSTLNVLLFAYKASNTNDILRDKISTIIPQKQQINPDEFCAYLIENGISISIKGKSTGMIQENVIDEIGDILDDEFNTLMDIYSGFNSDK